MTRIIPTLTAIFVIGAATASHGAGIRIGFMDTYAVSRGNTFAATADSPAAVFYNPAGITQVEGSEASAGVYLIRLSSEYTTPDGANDFSMRDRFQPVPHVYYTAELDELPISIGLGAYLPFGLVSEWPDEAPISFQATRSELQYARLSPVLAWEAAPGLSIGGGPTFNFVEARLRRNEFSGDPANPIAGEYRFKGRDSAIGYSAAAHWQPHAQHAFGLTYHSPTRIGLSGSDKHGDASIDKLRFPEIVIAGYSFRPTPDWNIEFNIDWTRWSRFDSLTLRQGDNTDVQMDLDWEDIFFYGLGATRFLPGGYRISAGYLYTERAVPSDSYWPAVPDSAYHFVSGGLGLRGERISWDLAYHYGRGPSRTIPGNPAFGGMDGAGRYENRIHGASLTLTSTF